MNANRYVMFEIFETKSAGDTKTESINTLLGYPSEGAQTYRELMKKYEADEWAGVVTSELTSACEKMTYEEKLPYYDENNLKSFQWLKDNEWFVPPDEVVE